MKKALAKAGVWLYPTRFPEISCMAAMETMAHGVIPVATQFGALAETLHGAHGHFLKPLKDTSEWYSEAADELVKATKSVDANRKMNSRFALRKFNLPDLADEWITKLGLAPAVAAGNTEGNDENVPEFSSVTEGAPCPIT